MTTFVSAAYKGFENAAVFTWLGATLYNLNNPKIYQSIFGSSWEVCIPCSTRSQQLNEIFSSISLLKQAGVDFFNGPEIRKKCILEDSSGFLGCRAINYVGSLAETISENSHSIGVGFGYLAAFFTLRNCLRSF